MEFFDFFAKSQFLNVIVLKLSGPEQRENSRKKFENRSILATFYEFKSHIEKSW
jgi:hypothetical protein